MFTQAYQSIGLGLATAIGAAIARPDRLTVAALGDGGALMGIAELETAVRLGLGLVIVVYDDEAYGAEVHHFGPDGHPLDTVRFPPTDIAAIGRGFGCAAITVRAAARTWHRSRLAGRTARPAAARPRQGDERTARHGGWRRRSADTRPARRALSPSGLRPTRAGSTSTPRPRQGDERAAGVAVGGGIPRALCP